VVFRQLIAFANILAELVLPVHLGQKNKKLLFPPLSFLILALRIFVT
jgi:hypothetical protein